MVADEVNPALAAHGGFVTYVGHDGEGTAYLTMGGGCHGCSMSRLTMLDGVQTMLVGGDRGHRAGQGPHRPHHRREPLLQLSRSGERQRLEDSAAPTAATIRRSTSSSRRATDEAGGAVIASESASTWTTVASSRSSWISWAAKPSRVT